MTSKKLKEEIKKSVDKIAKERDKLRLLLSETEDVIDSCSCALEDFEHGLDNLSQYL
jgi:hypothetical protein